MVSKKQLQNLKMARAIRQRNLLIKRNSPKKVKSHNRFVKVPRTTPILNPQLFSQRINPDLDVTKTDLGYSNEKISSSDDLDVTKTDLGYTNEKISANEGIFTNMDDVFPRVLRRRR